MLAESVHSAADCANQLLLLLGIRQARQEPTPDHPLGFGKATYFWSFMVALMLFSMGGAFSIYEGVHKLSAPEPVQNPWVAIAVLAGMLMANLTRFVAPSYMAWTVSGELIVMTVLGGLGTLIGGIVVSMYLPIFKLGQVV